MMRSYAQMKHTYMGGSQQFKGSKYKGKYIKQTGDGKSIFLSQTIQSMSLQNEDKRNQQWKKAKISEIKAQHIKIKSWKDLNILKNKYRTEILLNKSHQKIKQENAQLNHKVKKMLPRIDSWNKPPSIEEMSQDNETENNDGQETDEGRNPSQERVKKYLRNVKTCPKNIEKSFNQSLYEENLKIYHRIERAPTKVDSWNDSLAGKYMDELNKEKRKKNYKKIRKQNKQLIEKVEETPPKVQNWNSLDKLSRKLKLKQKIKNNPQKISKTFDLIKMKIQLAERNLRQRDQLERRSYTQRAQMIRSEDNYDFRVRKGKQVIKRVEQTQTTIQTVNNRKSMKAHSYLVMLGIKQRKQKAQLMKRRKRLEEKNKLMEYTFKTFK